MSSGGPSSSSSSSSPSSSSSLVPSLLAIGADAPNNPVLGASCSLTSK